ncbi:MAG: sigma-70 family RNA polymerase sigma factor [Chloroflexota bacterium]
MQTTASSHLEETCWIESAQRGDLEAFNELILRHQDALFNVAVRMLGDEDKAADAVQEALVSAWRSLRTFSGGSFRAWLSRAVINKCYDEFRRSSRHPVLPLVPVVDGEELEDREWLRDPSLPLDTQMEASELDEAIQTCLQTLPLAHRSVLVMVDVDGMNYDEAAASLGIPIGTVKSRLARARASLRAALRDFSDLLPSPFQIRLPVAA